MDALELTTKQVSAIERLDGMFANVTVSQTPNGLAFDCEDTECDEFLSGWIAPNGKIDFIGWTVPGLTD